MSTKLQTPQPARGVQFQLNPNTFTRIGYTFLGWNRDWSATTAEYSNEANVTFDSDVDLYAIWKQNKCLIRFNSMGGTEVTTTLEIPQGQTIGTTLPTTSMTKQSGLAGMQFDGWWTEADGGILVTENTVVPYGLGEITLYAHWIGIIHYQRVSKNTSQMVSIDSNGVASGFDGSDDPSNMFQCALESIPDDKFDFSGEFTIVMKCQVKTNRRDINYGAVLPDSGGLTRQCSSWDVFGCYWVHDSQNYYCDFGLLMEVQSGNNIKYTQWEIASDYNDKRTVGPFYSYGTRLNQTAPAGWATKPFLLKVERRYVDSKWVIRTYLWMDDGLNWTLECENTNAMQPLAAGQFCIGNDSDSYSEYFPGSIFLNDCYLVQENPNSAQPRGKYKLRLLEAAQYVVTFDKQGGSGGTSTTTATYNAAMPSIEPPTRTDYIFDGYYSGTNGTGTQYYNADGTSARTWDKTSDTTLYALWEVVTEKDGFDARPIVSSGCYSLGFNNLTVQQVDFINPTNTPQQDQRVDTADQRAVTYLSEKYAPNSEWRNIDIGQGTGVDHLVFTHIPGKKKYTIEMDVSIQGLSNYTLYRNTTPNVNGSAVVRLFFVGQDWEYSPGSTLESYIDGSAVTKLTYQRGATGNSFDLVGGNSGTSIATAYQQQVHIVKTIDCRQVTSGQMAQPWLDGWIYIDHTGSFGDSYLKAVCTNCHISWTD